MDGYSKGQCLAVEQLQDIENKSGGALELISTSPDSSLPNWIQIEVSLDCSKYSKRASGIPFRDRERFMILITPRFPYTRPFIYALTDRFAGYPHVFWKRFLCLYQAPDTEWDYREGMYGYLQRLDQWLSAAALGNLDPIDAPMHPPTASTTNKICFIAKENTPQFNTQFWCGFVHLKAIGDNGSQPERYQLSQWIPVDESPQRGDYVAPCILLSNRLPYEFPSKLSDLLDSVSSEVENSLFETIKMAIRYNAKSSSLFVVFGSPMRGIAGDESKQHLAVWKIEDTEKKDLYKQLKSTSTNKNPIGKLREWSKKANVQWCKLMEARPEIVTARDHQSPLAWFKNKRVAIWGCGALGAHIALMLARTGVSSLVLRDNKVVTPGILSRQPFEEGDIGISKSQALSKKIGKISSEIKITVGDSDIQHLLIDDPNWQEEVDIILDATASRSIAGLIEKNRLGQNRPATLASFIIDNQAQRGLVSLATSDYLGGTYDISQKLMLRLLRSPSHRSFSTAFFPTVESPPLFQPEPGCSDPTFIGSSADTQSLAGSMLNLIAKDLLEDKPSSSHLITQPYVKQAFNQQGTAHFYWPPDKIIEDNKNGYQIRITYSAWRDVKGYINQGARLRGAKVETGGLLFGQIDDHHKIVRIYKASGPPPDSTFSKTEFVCGSVGTDKMNKKEKKDSNGAVQFVGMWHTHPVSSGVPSSKDQEGMNKLFQEALPSPPNALLLIVGNAASNPAPIGYIYNNPSTELHSLETLPPTVELNKRAVIKINNNVGGSSASTGSKNKTFVKSCEVGLALSGGGSRAIAFHLGCIRALHDMDILRKTGVISAVSGGSVIAGMYAYHDEAFEAFEERVISMLEKGLLSSILKKWFFSERLFQIFWTNVVAGLPAYATKLSIPFLNGSGGKHPPIRSVSRTNAFEDVLRNGDFIGTGKLSNPLRDIDVVFNTAELRTQTVFRYGNRESGNWRFGKLADENVPVSRAVATSAAYPLLLPAYHHDMPFMSTKTDDIEYNRVVLTDGGVYDNLGTTCLEPGRNPNFSFNSYAPQYIISCSAGYGVLKPSVAPYGMYSRMNASVNTLLRKVQDGTMQRLHGFTSNSDYKGFVLPYLGQEDHKMPGYISGLIKKDEIYGYPTDFSSMPKEMIEKISKRGEQLTRHLVTTYFLDL